MMEFFLNTKTTLFVKTSHPSSVFLAFSNYSGGTPRSQLRQEFPLLPPFNCENWHNSRSGKTAPYSCRILAHAAALLAFPAIRSRTLGGCPRASRPPLRLQSGESVQ
jgi:hypothetical protein